MTKQTTPTLDLATQLKEFLESLRVGGGDTGEYAIAAQRQRMFEAESRRAAEQFSAGSEQRLKHMESAARSARKARACELVYEGAAIPVAVASVVSGAVEVAAPVPPAAEPKKGAKVQTSKKSRDKGAKDAAPAYSKELEAAVLACGTEAELNLLVHERKLGKKEFAEHKERLGGVGQYWTNLQVVIGNQRESLRASDLATIEGEIAAGGGDRFYRVCQAMNEYHGLIGQERERAAGGWTVLLELPDGGDWIEEQFDRTILVPTTREAFEQQPAAAGAFKTGPVVVEPKKKTIAPPMAKTTIPAHRWRGATWLTKDECVVCGRDSKAVVHVAPSVRAKRIKAGLPANTAGDWLGYALQHADYSGDGLKNPHEGKKLTDARRLDWQNRLDRATKALRLSWTLYNLAQAVEAGTLPKALHGLTNDLQVRDSINLVLLGRTAGEQAAALAPYVQEVEQFTVDGELAKQGHTAEPAPAEEPAPSLTLPLPALGVTLEVEPHAEHAGLAHIHINRDGGGAQVLRIHDAHKCGGCKKKYDCDPATCPEDPRAKFGLCPECAKNSRVGRRFQVKIASPKRLYDCIGVCITDTGTGVVLDVTDFRGKREERVYPNSAVLMLEEEQPAQQDDDPTAFGKAPEDEQLFPFAGTEYSDGGLLQPYGCKLCETMMPVTLAPAREHIRQMHARDPRMTDPSADPRKCEACEVVYDTNNPAEAEMHDHPDDQETLKGQALVRQLVKCEDAEALALAISRYRLDDLEGVAGLTSADRERIISCIAERRGYITEQAHTGEAQPPRYLKLALVGDTRPTSRVGRYVGRDLGLYVVELPTGETTKIHEAHVKGDATAEEFEALKPARPTPAATPAAKPTATGRCGECAYKLPMHSLTCRTGQREQEAA